MQRASAFGLMRACMERPGCGDCADAFFKTSHGQRKATTERTFMEKSVQKNKSQLLVKLVVSAVLACVLSFSAVPAYAAGGSWVHNNVGWWYRNADGSYPASQWERIGGQWYHFNSGGYMQTGWQLIGGKWYYLKSSGAMATGWNKVGGTWYYHDASGAMKTGWQKVGKDWFYLLSDGSMAADCWIGGSSNTYGEYWVSSSGVWTFRNEMQELVFPNGALVNSNSNTSFDKEYNRAHLSLLAANAWNQKLSRAKCVEWLMDLSQCSYQEANSAADQIGYAADGKKLTWLS